MTALKKYQRLESPGLWRDTPDGQRREVIVAFREATLVLSDPRTGMPVSHWSLPAVERQNPGQVPAIYGPGEEPWESLEVEDSDMIQALETVRGAVARRRPRPGRLRGAIFGAVVVLLGAPAILWMPDLLVRHTASVLPDATRAEIGRMVLADLVRITGQPCTSPQGSAALQRLAQRVFGQRMPLMAVLPDGLGSATHLPGGMILLGRALIELSESADAPAGFALAEALRADLADPMLPLLSHAGLVATFRLLTTGTLPEGSVSGYAETLLRSEPLALGAETLLARFDAAGVSAAPYAYALDPTGQATAPLLKAPAAAPRPVLSDDDWVALQGICAGT